MGLFSTLKKKKELPELETPPPVEEIPEQQTPQPAIPAFSMDSPENEMPLQAFQSVPLPPDDMRAQTPQLPVEEIPKQQTMPSPPQQFEEFPKSSQLDFPEIRPEAGQYNIQPAVEPPQLPKEALSLFQPSPQFKFYTAPAEEHTEIREQEIPFDVKQELLTMPKEAKMPEQQKPHMPRTFLTLSMLMDIGEQLINLNDDIALGKDTAFRFGDLNEQEIEKMAKWHALHQSMELRLAQMDKILFRA